MDLKEIVSISGKPGLYKIIASTGRGVVVESLDVKKTRLPVNGNQQVAALEEITIYTPTDENIPLKDIIKNIEDKKTEGQDIPSHKDNPVAIREFFKSVAPGYDEERVYISDIKKVLKWYNILKANETA